MSRSIEDKYRDKIESFLLGTTYTKTDGSYTYMVRTSVGDWHISIRDIGIFTRFANPTLACSKVDCNPYTGKLNFILKRWYDNIGNFETILNNII